VLSTPTAILVSGGVELRRAVDAETISRLLNAEDSAESFSEHAIAV